MTRDMLFQSCDQRLFSVAALIVERPLDSRTTTSTRLYDCKNVVVSKQVKTTVGVFAFSISEKAQLPAIRIT